jgi:hypothetical protein
MAAVRTTAVSGVTAVDVDTTINFRGGEFIDFVNAGGTVISNAHKITAIDRTNRNITITPATVAGLTATTHFIVRASSDSTIATPNNSQNREIQGVASIVSDTGTLHTVNPATFPFWKSYKKTAIGAISDSALRDLKDGIGFESGVDLQDPNGWVLISDRGIRRRYADTLLSVKRFNDAQSVKLHGGFTALMFDENPWFVDDYSPIGQVAGLSLQDMFWAQMSDWDWMDEDGKVLKWETGKDRYTAVLYKYSQLGTTRRNAHGILTGVTDDVR